MKRRVTWMLASAVLAAAPAFGWTLVSPPVHAGSGQSVRCSVAILRPNAWAGVVLNLVSGDGRSATDWVSDEYSAASNRSGFGLLCGRFVESLPSTDARFCTVNAYGFAAQDIRASVEVREGAKLVAVVGF